MNNCIPGMEDLTRLAELIGLHRYRFSTEAELQEGLFEVFTAAGETVSREVRRVGGADRYDMVVGRIAVEVKIKGSLGPFVRQLFRYSERPEFEGILAVVGSGRLDPQLDHLGDKPLVTVRVRNWT